MNCLQKETAKVAKLLAVPENVTVEVKPSKPEFFSWESTVMQAYVKSGSLTLGILLILGIFYELIRRHKKHKVKKKTNPKIRKFTTMRFTKRKMCKMQHELDYKFLPFLQKHTIPIFAHCLPVSGNIYRCS